MKKLILLLFLCGCSSKKENQEQMNPATDNKNFGINTPDDFSRLMDYFKLISFDTLHVYYDNQEENSILIGKRIPEKFLTFFPEVVRMGATEWSVDDVYAVYKFKYSPDIMALIARVPSEYSSSELNIFLYSIKNKKLLYSRKIAEFTGDGGDLIEENSWLLDINNDNLVDIVTKKRETYSLDEDLTKFENYDSAFVFLGTPTGFERTKDFTERIDKYRLKKRKQIF